MGKLQALREFNVRKNSLEVLPEGQNLPSVSGVPAHLSLCPSLPPYFPVLPPELADLPLVKLDFSCNKISEIPPAYRKLRQLQLIVLDNNPLRSPPAQVGAIRAAAPPLWTEPGCAAGFH